MVELPRHSPGAAVSGGAPHPSSAPATPGRAGSHPCSTQHVYKPAAARVIGPLGRGARPWGRNRVQRAQASARFDTLSFYCGAEGTGRDERCHSVATPLFTNLRRPSAKRKNPRCGLSLVGGTGSNQ
jgi:hypothetical protein